MKSKILNILLVISSSFIYLEWGKENHCFLIEIEFKIFKKLFIDPVSLIHPLIILPLLGQIILVVTIFQKKLNKTLTYIGLFGIGILATIIFFIGIISLNHKIFISTIPFIFIAYKFSKHLHFTIQNKY